MDFTNRSTKLRRLRLHATSWCAAAMVLSPLGLRAEAESQQTNAPTTIPVNFSESATEATRLDPVVVNGTREVTSAPLSSGLGGAAHTQPLSITSLSRQELMDRGARDLSQALASVASVNAPVDFQVQSSKLYTMRGFSASVLVDGFESLGLTADRDSLVGIERIDFVKGPGSALNSGGLGLPPGGAIDIHSAWPGARPQFALQLSGSRYGQRAQQIDVDSGDIVPVVSVGLAAARGNGEGFFDYSELNSKKIRPSLSLRAFGARVSVYVENATRTQTDYPGLPTTGTLDTSQFKIPDSRSVMDPDVPLSVNTLKGYGFDLDAPLGEWFTFSAAGRKADSTISEFTQYVSSNAPDLAPLAPSTWSRSAGTYQQETHEAQARARLTGRYEFDEFGRFAAWIGYGGEDAPDHVALQLGLALPIDLANPTYGQWTGAPIPFQEADSHFHIRNLNTGLQWRYNEWLNFFAAYTRTSGAVRNYQTTIVNQLISQMFGPQTLSALKPTLDQIQQSGLLLDTGTYVNRVDHYQLGARQFGVSVRAWDALSDEADDGLWIFYGQGNGQQFHAYFVSGSSPLPELSNQHEAGIRLVRQDWGKLEAAAFRIQRRNVPTLDPNSLTGFDQITSGLQSVRGIDFEGLFRAPYPILDRFTLNTSGALLKSRIDEDNTYPVGNQLANVPKVQWRLQFAADVFKTNPALRVFVAHRCQSDVKGDLKNSFTVPARCLSDAGATASWQGFTIDAVVNNLADIRYYEPYTYLFYGVIPGDRRTARLSLAYAFGAQP